MYWKFVIDGELQRIYRLENGKFMAYGLGRWEYSDRWEEAVQDPEFKEITKQEAEELIKLFPGVARQPDDNAS